MPRSSLRLPPSLPISPAMREATAACSGLTRGRLGQRQRAPTISGALGRGEGIAAQAVALLEEGAERGTLRSPPRSPWPARVGRAGAHDAMAKERPDAPPRADPLRGNEVIERAFP